MAVDGLVRKEQGREGVILTDDRGHLAKILILVNGNSSDVTSYGPELNVIYPGYLFLLK